VKVTDNKANIKFLAENLNLSFPKIKQFSSFLTTWWMMQTKGVPASQRKGSNCVKSQTCQGAAVGWLVRV